MRNVTINTSIDITTDQQESEVAAKLQGLILELRTLIPDSENYSIDFTIINQNTEDEGG